MGFYDQVGAITGKPVPSTGAYDPGVQFFGMGGNLPTIPGLDPNKTTKSPFTSSLSKSIQALQGINPNVDYTPQAYKQDSSYQAKDFTNTAMPGYDALRNRVKGQYAQAADQAQERLQRQFAAAGGGPGNGALAKQTTNLATDMASKQDADMQNVDFQEQQAREQKNQQEQQRAYESGEALKGRQFTDFQRQAQQQFENIQNNASRGLQLAGLRVDANSKLAQLDQDWAQKQIDAQIEKYNAELAAYTTKHSGGLFGGGGFLGLGIG